MQRNSSDMVILLRQEGSGLYLQPDGEWNDQRTTARRFVTSVTAYAWALEQRLLGVEVLMAFSNPVWDFVSMRVSKQNRDI